MITGKRLNPFSRKGAAGKAYPGMSATETRPSAKPKGPRLPAKAADAMRRERKK